MATTEARIPFPIKGVNRRLAYQDQAEQTTPSAMNVFVSDSQGSRYRGGTRPGFVKLFSEQIESPPIFIKSVSLRSFSDQLSSQIIVIGTASGFFVGKATKEFVGGRYMYETMLVSSESLVTTEDGDVLLFENGDEMGTNQLLIPNITRGLATVYQGNVVVADGSEPTITGTGTITANVLTSDTAIDWVASGVTSDRFYIEITDHSQGRSAAIVSVEESSVTLAGTWANGTCSYRVTPAALRFNADTLELSRIEPTAGFFPTDATVITVYRDRLVWAAGREWYMSRQGDPGDYNYGADVGDGGRAVAAALSDAGQPGDPVKAMAPSGFDYLILFAENSTWIMRGDPAYGGQLTSLSRLHGCIDTDAWCYGTNGEIFFLSKSGIHVIPPDASGPPQSLSEDPLPLDLQELDSDNYLVTLAFDVELESVFIFASGKGSVPSTNWSFHVPTASFWPFSFASDGHEPVAGISYSVSPQNASRTTIVSADGYVRQIGGETDDGAAIDAWAILGPFQINGGWTLDGLVSAMYCVLSNTSQSVSLKVFAAESPEQCVSDAEQDASPDFQCIIGGGRSRMFRMRVRGDAVCLRIQSTSPWAMELISMTVAQSGLRRF